jgi:phage terminase large subunit
MTGAAAHEYRVPKGSWQAAWLQSRDNTRLFVTGVLGVLEVDAPNPDGLPQLDKWQAAALDDFDKYDRISIRSGHGTGKTTFLSWLVLKFLLTRKDTKIPIAANSQDQLRDIIWPEIKKWWRRLPLPLQQQVDIQAEKIFIRSAPEAAFAVRRTASKDNPEALQGFHADNLLFLIEEASGIPDIIFEVAMGALSTPGAKVVLAANPTRTNGFFFDTHNKLRHRWHTIVVNSENVPRARGHIQDVIDAYGKGSNKYRVRVLGEFPTADDDTVIALDTVIAATTREIEPLDYVPVWGLDVARFGDDDNALCKRCYNRVTEPIMTWGGMDLVKTLGILTREYNETPDAEKPKKILVDSIGVGGGIVDFGRAEGLPVYGINVAESASSDERYQRMRDELWFLGRKWFEDKECSIPEDQAFISELTAPTYDFHANGKIVVESKRDMKTRGLKSPNRADSFLLTFATNSERLVKKKKRRSERPSGWAS